ncbi:TetR/AcrR family transcriptional regulator [Leucobacter massiliensis]|uniref:HTH tetR-type domain-containing protein n=1 Tax=Leucobacter massiliensis TaxID=1686285 RepID=A0A2S9QSN5_9MICO|nr:TetR/AcrR family transcriptional regulator [Leucobacter massiliensis]PRI12600.1 hypothetical protein B4915_00600 [Leucobacter massiliensis]
MSTGGRAAQEAPGTRQRILREASLLFWRHGYRGTSTRQIADAVGVQQPSLFHFFPSKRAIMEELLALSLDETLVGARAARAADGPVAARLQRYVFDDLLVIHRGEVVLAGAHASDVVHEPGFEAWAAKLEELAAILQGLVAEGVAAGEFLPIDPVLAQEMIAGVTISHITMTASGRPPASPEELAEQGARFLLRGLTGRPG